MPRYKKLKMVSPNTICVGDSLKVLKRVANNSIDLICSDPPYGIKFMGKKWDKAVPSVDIWKECLRVLKPGAFAFIMCSPRQDCLARMLMNLEKAGFVMGFTSIYWTYATGFPKAGNVSKMIDKRLGVKPNKIIPASGVGFMNTNDDGYHTTKNRHIMPNATTPQAKLLNGSYVGFQPKPAVEVIIVAMKPLSEKTYIDQVMKNGKGVSWFDDCRIPATNRPHRIATGDRGKGSSVNIDVGSGFAVGATDLGRFPANLLVSDDALNDGTFRRGDWYRGKNRDPDSKCWYGSIKADAKDSFRADKGGSYSRYFDLDAWWAERISDLPEGAQKTFPYLAVAKPGKSEKTHNGTIENKHPTVKPLKLMSYLVTLGSRPGDIVLDPFCGSGTTCVAAKTLKRKYIGIDQDKQWVEVSRQRLDTVP
jgi:site-specific DNA-methyltransferase (adenine-specific)